MTGATVHHGDCRDVLAQMARDGVLFDACVTDPPYGLTFMGHKWDDTGVAFDPATWRAVYDVMRPGAHLLAFGGTRTQHRLVCAIEDAGFEIRDSITWITGQGFPKSHSALKPAHEPICVARKPLDGTVAGNVLRHRCGGLNIDASRVMTGQSAAPFPRWPANVIHDGSPEVEAAFAAFGERTSGGGTIHNKAKPPSVAKGQEYARIGFAYGDTGSAARFFFSAKASAADRAGSKHPTVKPQTLMRHLCTLVTPPGGHLLDPFAGSGSTLQAALRCGFLATGIEREIEYVRDTRARLALPQVDDDDAEPTCRTDPAQRSLFP